MIIDKIPFNIFTRNTFSKIKYLAFTYCIPVLCLIVFTIGRSEAVCSQSAADSSEYNTKKDNTYWYYSDRINLHDFDTSLLNLEEYNFIQRKGIEYRNLGNLGSAAYPLQLNPNQQTGFDHGLHHVDLYRLEWDSMKLYNLNYPFVQISYILGLKSESKFSASHGQMVTQNLDYGVDFIRVNSEGFFKNQKNLHNNFTAYSRLRSKNRRYELLARVLMNDMELEENGGLTTDVYDTSETIINRAILDVNLEDAKSQINELAFGVEQSYSLGFKKELIVDSLPVTEWIPTFVFSYDAVFRRNKYRYRDFSVNDDFYGEFGVFADSLEFNQRHTTIEQNLNLSNTGIAKSGTSIRTLPVLFNAGITYKRHQITQKVKRTFDNLSVHGGISSNPNDKSRIIYRAEASAYLSGYNRGDLKINGSLGYNLGNAGLIENNLSLISAKPDYIQERLESELFWINDFKNVRKLQYNFRYHLSQQLLNVGFSYINIGNYIYYGGNGFPAQLSEDLNGVIVRIRKDFKLGSKFRLDNSIVYQVYSQDEDVLSKPKVMTKNSFYYTGFLFKKALQASVGIDFRMYSKYYMPLYLPITGTFYVQEKILVEPYPLIDIFAILKIDALRLFFKVNNVSQGLIKEGTYSAKYYPFSERSFRFGLSWMFEN